MDFFVDFGCAPSIYISKINEKITVSTGTPFQRQEVSGNKKKTNTIETQCNNPHKYVQ